jgi:protein-S-isoprenylcysteine O-methyltransferase Ste14
VGHHPPGCETVCLALTLLLAGRIIGEAQVLIRELPGYAAYRQQVRYRLIPGVW